jgi:outer membrane protein OmpA-like peptidoglycan-associated protein
VCGGKPHCLGTSETVSFAKKSKSLSADASPALERIARWLAETPEVREVEVRGYAKDGAGRGELLLASSRATNASQWLVAHGVAPARIVPRGFANAPPDPPHVESGVEITVTVPDQAGCCSAACL